MRHSEINCQGHFYFDPDDPIYRDHFPGHPVVPGSLIVHAFMVQAGNQGATMEPWSPRDFRFKRFIPPGRYAFQMQTNDDGRMACTLYDHDLVVATGTL